MTTQTLNPVPLSSAGSRGLNFGGVLKSEFIKFWTLLSTKLLLVISLLAIVGIAAIGAWGIGFITQDRATGVGPQGPAAASSQALDLSSIPHSGVQLGMLVLGALAVMFIASEYGTGMIRSSFAAVPRRLPVFTAKALVLIVVTYLVTTVAAFLSFLVAIPILKAYNVDISLDQEGMLSGILLCGLLVAGVALMGLSLGTLLRNSAGGIVVLVGILFVLPIAGNFLQLLPGDFWKYVPDYLPSNAGSRMLATGHTDGLMDPWAAGLVFLAWIVVLLIPAVFLLKKRDA
ncbi:ABC transporter permease [Psychromicrobium sp. YIM B11713]|uniref:ABC transporter permease n=1 Tax=Psychromicrobium sp. YIM B11713 TaxID=3145233 RepID=UPI00374F5945